MGTGLVTLSACGDVMPGRGIDQILPHPGDPKLREDHADGANAYVRLAERANGPISRPASFSWPWGDALPVLAEAAPAVRVINLETSRGLPGCFPQRGEQPGQPPGRLVCWVMNGTWKLLVPSARAANGMIWSLAPARVTAGS